ncbi:MULTISPECIES: hypothetical protein [unclassified Tatumella]|uniref:hypothetical protein n=1 Tax=unclassified Tatumella TaxID=2649542 RepID=UPI001BAF2C3C|nr:MULTISPECIES: hypothetical protein [unclassified Tatumella]MBS0878556.1 hypothetical protein [Tatumella sp. JGM82]MBS0892053.1 hypothetical protein [Tatumella sp. JGM94]MBS0900832.1 hypothetical protein [Tatumella sp. JGM100]
MTNPIEQAKENKLETLATGAKLTPETFADFLTRLKHDVVGQGAEHHCTRDAIFNVERLRRVSGIDLSFDPLRMLTDSDHEVEWFSPKEYWDSLDLDEKKHLNEECLESEAQFFLDLAEDRQWQFLGDRDYLNLYGYQEDWQYVNSHLTRESAEAFIKRKSHDYPDGLRVFVDSRVWCPEFTAIVDALINGQLILK